MSPIATATPARRAPRLLRNRRAALVRERVRRSSRSRTSATSYQKVGRYASSPDILSPGTISTALNPPAPSVRGFGFLHDGTIGDLQHFFMGQVFIEVPPNATTLFGAPVTPNPFGIPFEQFDASGNDTGQLDPTGFPLRHAIVSFLMAFESNEKPIVGQQATLTAANEARADIVARLALLESQAQHGSCDLVVKGIVDGEATGFTYTPGTHEFVSDRHQPGDARRRAAPRPRQSPQRRLDLHGSAGRLGVAHPRRSRWGRHFRRRLTRSRARPRWRSLSSSRIAVRRFASGTR